ncbi:MAG: GNAT family N-acetyltransferase [Microcella sp.]|uniref:GNAT family N-acetyltransferase n=1 Tax=Microcella sp. TaxID=1913979 RepID=UPI0027286B94|nr:GNAT family N-acetyltransferase [Microcella sp.]MDO8337745.1 GNAT family N-acetyltransferase [Microcella sp.]
MTTLLRPATVQDADALGSLHMACWREAYGDLLSAEFFERATPESSAERWAITIPRLASDGGTLLLAEEDGELVGFASSGPGRGEAPPRELELYAIYVRASAYGSGLGQRLLDAALGDRPASLWVLERNPRARAFYERNGFAPDGTTELLPRFENLVEIRLVR